MLSYFFILMQKTFVAVCLPQEKKLRKAYSALDAGVGAGVGMLCYGICIYSIKMENEANINNYTLR